MKRFLSAVLILILGFGAFAGNKKYLVWLSDKNNTPYNINNPLDFLSPKALDRRNKQSIAIDSLDIPVNTRYIDSIASIGVSILCTSKWLNTITISTNNTDLITTIESLNFVDSVNLTWVEPELKSARMKLESTQAIPYDYGVSLPQIAAHRGNDMHDKGYRGKGMLIAVLDAGFSRVNELKAFDSLWVNKQIVGTRDFINPGGDVYKEHTHGMAVLSVLGGLVPETLIGSAPEADYYLIRTEDNASEFPVEMDYWIAGAEFADSLGADIINSSLGYSEFDINTMNYTTDELDGKTIRVSVGAEIATSRGMLVVTSAGNEGNKAWKRITGPGDALSVLTVGSITKDSTYSTFSSIGPSADGRVKPEVMAIGTQTIIQQPTGSIGTGNGTSFSGPIISGMAACLWQALPNKTAKEIKDILIENSNMFTTPNDSFGYGIPNIYQAWLGFAETQIIEGAFKTNAFPNPLSSGLLTLKASANTTLEIASVFSLDGKLKHTEVFKNVSMASMQIPARIENGLYILTVKTNRGRTITKLRILR